MKSIIGNDTSLSPRSQRSHQTSSTPDEADNAADNETIFSCLLTGIRSIFRCSHVETSDVDTALPAIEWSAICHPFDPYTAIHSSERPIWFESGINNDSEHVDGLDVLEQVRPDYADAIREALDDARQTVEAALAMLARPGPLMTMRIAAFFGLPLPMVENTVAARLTFQYSRLYTYIQTLMLSDGKTISACCQNRQATAASKPTRGLLRIYLDEFLEQDRAARAWTMIHESVHLALGGRDYFYLHPDMEMKNGDEPFADMVSKAEQHHARVASSTKRGSLYLLMMEKGQLDRKTFTRIMGADNIVKAEQRFKTDPHVRIEVLLHNPDSLVLLACLLAGWDKPEPPENQYQVIAQHASEPPTANPHFEPA